MCILSTCFVSVGGLANAGPMMNGHYGSVSVSIQQPSAYLLVGAQQKYSGM